MSDGGRNPEGKLFIGGLSLDTTATTLESYFREFGEVSDAVVINDSVTKKSRGFGFVTYKDPQCATRCLQHNPHDVGGKEVEVKRAVPKDDAPPSPPSSSSQPCKIFVGGLDSETTDDELRELFETYGPVTSAKVMTEKGTEKPRGFAFVIFDNSSTAREVCRKKYLKLKNRDIEVKEAKPREEMARGGGSRGGEKPSSYYGYGGDYGRGDPYHAAKMGYRDFMGGEYGGGYRMGPPGYDRGVYGYGRYAPPPMPSYASMYYGMPMGTYSQSASAYGPSRGYSGTGDGDRQGGGRGANYHPYRR